VSLERKGLVFRQGKGNGEKSKAEFLQGPLGLFGGGRKRKGQNPGRFMEGGGGEAERAGVAGLLGWLKREGLRRRNGYERLRRNYRSGWRRENF